MKGLELAKKYYLEFGNNIFLKYPELKDKCAIGLIGSGSECYGYDDELSQDHDFEPGFQIFIPSEIFVSSKEEFNLEREYRNLPTEFMGFKKQRVNPVGGSRHGVIRINDFLKSKCGNEFGDLSNSEFLYADESLLYEIANGEIFFDGFGELTKIREKLKYYPEDVRLKKISGYILTMAQTGEYNFDRLLGRNELAGAQISLFKYVDALMHVIFLLNKKYMPYYKWSFRALKDLEKLSDLYDDINYLISENNNEDHLIEKFKILNKIKEKVLLELGKENLTKTSLFDLESQAYEINDLIKDNNLRNANILEGV